MTPEVQGKDVQNPAEGRLELKYCEGCGALTLRTTGSEGVYCRPCSLRLSQIAFKPPRSRQGGTA